VTQGLRAKIEALRDYAIEHRNASRHIHEKAHYRGQEAALNDVLEVLASLDAEPETPATETKDETKDDPTRVATHSRPCATGSTARGQRYIPTDDV
jgi:hypothetical protein